jgi:DNA-binding response OmpR family regulator
MVKPFSLHELRARCRALLRRSRDTRLRLKVGGIELDRLDHSVSFDSVPVPLTNKEFALLEYLMLNRGRCASRGELLDAVWNLDPAQTTNIVDVYINYLRRKLHDPAPGQIIRTVRGQGYLVTSNPLASNPVASNPEAPDPEAPDPETPGFELPLPPPVQTPRTRDLAPPVIAN